MDHINGSVHCLAHFRVTARRNGSEKWIMRIVWRISPSLRREMDRRNGSCVHCLVHFLVAETGNGSENARIVWRIPVSEAKWIRNAHCLVHFLLVAETRNESEKWITRIVWRIFRVGWFTFGRDWHVVRSATAAARVGQSGDAEVVHQPTRAGAGVAGQESDGFRRWPSRPYATAAHRGPFPKRRPRGQADRQRADLGRLRHQIADSPSPARTGL